MVTTDLSEFSIIELEESAKLLKAYALHKFDVYNNKKELIIFDEMKLKFDSNSGTVFLQDNYSNIAILEDEKLILSDGKW